MELLILLAPVIVPAGVMYLTRRLGWRSVWAQLGAAALVCAALGSFLAAAGTAMATAVRPETAMLRGAGIGFLFGLIVGVVYLAVVAMKTRFMKKSV